MSLLVNAILASHQRAPFYTSILLRFNHLELDAKTCEFYKQSQPSVTQKYKET